MGLVTIMVFVDTHVTDMQFFFSFDINLNYTFKNVFFFYLDVFFFLNGLVREYSGQPLFFSFHILHYCASMWTCQALHSQLYDSTNE